MKIAGHTMGTPEYTVNEAIELFHRIGADGAEIVQEFLVIVMKKAFLL